MGFLVRKIPLVLMIAVILLAALAAAAYLSAGRILTARFQADIRPGIASRTGLDVDLAEVVIQPFPFFVEARGVRVSDPRSGAEFRADAVRAFFDPFALIARRALRVEAIVLKRPRIEGDPESLSAAFALLGRLGGEPGGAAGPARPLRIRFLVEAVEAREMAFRLRLGDGGELRAENLDLLVRPGPATTAIRMERADFVFSGAGRETGFRASAVVDLHRDGGLDVSGVVLETDGGARAELSGEDVLSGGELRIAGRVPVAAAAGLLGLSGRRTGELRIDGALHLDRDDPWNPEVDLELTGRGRIEDLFDAFRIHRTVEGGTTARLRIAGRLRDLRLEGTAHLDDGRILGLDEATVDVSVTYGKGILSFHDGRGRIIGGRASDVDVRVDLRGPVRYVVSCNVEGVDSRRLFRLVGWTPPHVPGGVTGYVVVEGGGAKDLSVKGFAAYSAGGPAGPLARRFTRASVGFSLEDGLLVLDPVLLEGEGIEAEARGRVDVREHRLAMDYLVRGRDLGPVLGMDSAGMAGRFLVQGRADGRFDGLLLGGRFEVLEGRIAGLDFDSLSGSARLREGRLDLEHLELRLDEALVEAEGAVLFPGEPIFSFAHPRLRLRLSYRNLDPEPVLRLFGVDRHVFRGTRLSGRVELLGPPGDLRSTVEASAEEAWILGQGFDRLSTRFILDDESVRIDRFEGLRGRSVLRFDGRVGRKGGYCLNLKDSEIFLEDVDLAPEGLGGAVRIDVDCFRRGGRAGELEGNGTVTVRDLSYRGVPFGGGELRVELRNDRLSFAGTLLDGQGRVSGWTFLAEKPMWALELETGPARRTAIVRAVLPDFPRNVEVEMGGRLSARCLGGETELRLRLSGFRIRTNGRVFTAEKDVEILWAGERLRIPPFTVRSGSSDFEAGGGWGPGTGLDLSLSGHVDLGLLRLFVPGFESLRGDAWMVLDAEGPVDAPRLSGSVHLEKGRFKLENVPGSFSELEGTLLLEDRRLTVDALEGRWGGGRVRLSGTGRIRGLFSLEDFHVEARLEEVALRPVRDLFLQFDADITLDGVGGRRYINGSLRFDRAVYRGWVDYRRWLKQARRTQGLPRRTNWLSDAELNVRIQGNRPLRIDNNIARASLDADLVLVGTVAMPSLLGRLEARSGKFFFRSQEFNLLHGSADFVDPRRINPIFSVSAETWTQGYTIRLNLEGPLDGFDMSLDADPYLEEADILALLTVGSLGSDLEGLEGGIGAAEAASFVAGDFQSAIEERMVYLTGVDRLQLDPHYNKSLGTLGARITVGKRLLSDDLFVTYSTDVGTMKGQRIRMEYHLFKGLSAIGDIDERGEAGGDLRVHFDFD